jgi:hypothetical protein
VKCKDELGAIEKTRWDKVNAMEIIRWRGEDVSWYWIHVMIHVDVLIPMKLYDLPCLHIF